MRFYNVQNNKKKNGTPKCQSQEENPEFVIKCCNTALKYHPANVNAMLTKSEAQKFYIQLQMKKHNIKKPQDIFSDNEIKAMYAEMEKTYVKLYELGYRRMPEEMYLQWINLLKNEPDKYIDVNMKRNK